MLCVPKEFTYITVFLHTDKVVKGFSLCVNSL